MNMDSPISSQSHSYIVFYVFSKETYLSVCIILPFVGKTFQRTTLELPSVKSLTAVRNNLAPIVKPDDQKGKNNGIRSFLFKVSKFSLNAENI